MGNISSLITPFRWYDKFHNQNRFDIDCNSECEFKLITDPYHILPFQFKRAASPYLITDWILRRCCDDPNTKMLPKVDSNFVDGSMSWDNSPLAWSINNCGGICARTNEVHFGGNVICWTGLTPGKEYTFNLVINAFNDTGGGHSMLNLFVKNGATTIATLNSLGLHTLTFTATSTTFCLDYPTGTADGDVICVNYVQIEEAFELIENDVILAVEDIKYFSDGTTDYFIHCGAQQRTKLPLGCYYSIIMDEDRNLYFSEVITIKEFIPEKSPYLLLQWSNTCDLKDIIYHEVCQDGCCSYVNKLWLEEAVLTKPTYPFKEEGEEDGNQSFNATFQKLDKTVDLIIPRCPEFIVDSLNGVRLHDTIEFYKPINTKQEFVEDAVLVKSAETDTAFIFNDCFANVTMKCLLFEKFVDETCCVEIPKRECVGCVEIPEIDVFNEDVYEYALILTPGSDEVGLWKYTGSMWELQDSDSDVLICDGAGSIWQYDPTHPGAVSGYIQTPRLYTIAYVSGNTWHITGAINTFSFGLVQISTNGGVTWVDTLTKFTSTELAAGVDIEFAANPCCGPFDVRLISFDLNECDYGSHTQEEFGTSPTNDCC